MRSTAFVCVFAVAASACFADVASAGVKVTARKTTYDISGKSGAALLEAMDRRGPKHGLLTRAIAQTKYKVEWDMDWAEEGGACRLKKADADLSITYIYPRVTDGIAPQLNKRWARFITGVRKHEETHGSIARQMVNAAMKSVSGLTIRADRGCYRAKTEMKKRVAAVYAEYERHQMLFDKKEHSGGGNVEGLVAALRRAN